ncbi:hypothetical protein HHI36_007511 [Cryptolaemus montrouzieri]|uniref:Uncharacterized protein n=1 Tax=Cryptolaemus montrouzieri TaxID=559131 RepID=A0ABD2MPW3_9CUCU
MLRRTTYCRLACGENYTSCKGYGMFCYLPRRDNETGSPQPNIRDPDATALIKALKYTDTAHCPKAKTVHFWLTKIKPWPGNLPDMNPIENIGARQIGKEI